MSETCQYCEMHTGGHAWDCPTQLMVHAFFTAPIPRTKPIPFKCPSCDGWGQRQQTPYWGDFAPVQCPACNGTGIVWRFE
jgi:hypothetical protein